MVRTGVILTFTIICTVIAWIDIQKKKIYNETVAVLFVPAIVSFFVFSEINISSRIWGAVSVSGIMLVTCLLKPGAFGGGDIKMMVPVGLFLGIERTVAAGMIALSAEAVWCLVHLLRSICEIKGRKEGKGRTEFKEVFKGRFAFGPALCLGSVAAVIWGERIWRWIAGS